MNCGQIKALSRAGGLRLDGYVSIGINKKRYLAHRLAWLYVYGKWPKFIDHDNGQRADNSINNLKSGTIRQNNQNQKCHRDGKFPGVRYKPGLTKPYQSQFQLGKKKITCGYFKTELEAYNAKLIKMKEMGL